MMATPAQRLWLIVCLLFAAPAVAIEQLQIDIADWQFAEFFGKDSQLSFELTGQGLAMQLQASRLKLPQLSGELSNVRLHCLHTRLYANGLDCRQGRLQFEHPLLQRQDVRFSLTLDNDSQHYQLTLQGLQLGQAPVELQAEWQAERWQLALKFETLALDTVQQLAVALLAESVPSLLQDWTFAAKVSGTLQLTGQGSSLTAVNSDLQLAQLTFSNPDSRYVAETLAGQLQLHAEQKNRQWRWQKQVQISDGQTYLQPVYIDFAPNPVHVHSWGHWQPDQQQLSLTVEHFEQQQVVTANGQLNLQDNQLQTLRLHMNQADLAVLYPTWLQPFLLGSAAAELETAGVLSADLHWQRDSIPELRLQFEQVSLGDTQQRFGIDGLQGQFGWTASSHQLHTRLRWDAARLYALPIGAAAVEAEAQDSALKLTSPLLLPLLDGELQIHDFALQLDAQGQAQWHFDGLLTPLSMQLLSEKLGWPTLYGRLSGVIPRVSYSLQQVVVEGALLLQLFDGTTVIRDLRLYDPLGALPQLTANVDISGLDLELLTQAFDFGKISGKLDGRIHDLRLANWQPVQFDARFATPSGDRSRRRISQQAVDNLSQIGGGASGILSRSFLRFFEDFSYQQLGLSCRLQNSVCEMAGVADAEHGYYIVQGGGILPPWINVVGYTRRVDWPDLLERLKAVSQSSGPVIE